MPHANFLPVAQLCRLCRLPALLIGALGLLAAWSGSLLLVGQALGLALLLGAAAHRAVQAAASHLVNRQPRALRLRPSALLSPLQRWQCYQEHKRLVAAHYREQIRRAVAWGWAGQAIRLEQRLHEELRQLNGGCAAALRQLHAGLAGERRAEARWVALHVGDDGRLPDGATLVALASQPIGTLLAPDERLPFHGLAHRLAYDHRQGARLRQLAAAASDEAPGAPVLTRSMKLFLQAICEQTAVARCPVCHAFVGAAACQRCQALRTDRWRLPHRLVALRQHAE